MSKDTNKPEGEKKKGKKGAAVGAGAALIAALALLASKFGLPFGLGEGLGLGGTTDNSGNISGISQEVSAAEGSSAAEQTTAQKPESSAATVEKVEITVNGSNYLYKNSIISLSDLVGELKNLGPDISVTLKDENAALNAYRSLTKALDEAKIPYTEVH